MRTQVNLQSGHRGTQVLTAVLISTLGDIFWSLNLFQAYTNRELSKKNPEWLKVSSHNHKTPAWDNTD